ncbi:MAG TPA: hypothetical protein VF147_15435, partial [Vicinamibacterales bacterium]
ESRDWAARKALASLAYADSDRRASVAVETAVMAAFAAHHAPRRSEWRSWGAIAAALVIVAGLSATWRTLRSDPAAVPPAAAAQQVESDFVPWPGAAALPAFESGQLVRTEIPVSVLPLLGISQADVPANGHVLADVLYGQDGLARAVRVVRMQP